MYISAMLRGRVSLPPLDPEFTLPVLPLLALDLMAERPPVSVSRVDTEWLCDLNSSAWVLSSTRSASTPLPLSQPRMNSPRRSGTLSAPRTAFSASVAASAPLHSCQPDGGVAPANAVTEPVGLPPAPPPLSMKSRICWISSLVTAWLWLWKATTRIRCERRWPKNLKWN